MKFLIPILAMFTMSGVASADCNVASQIVGELASQSQVMAQAGGGLHLHAGDTAGYKLNLASFIQGKLDMKVREETSEGFWIVQNIDLMIQKQTVETLLDK